MEQTPKISLNVHLQVPPSSGAQAQDGSHTPNTPEIVNSIVNMTAGPFSSDFNRGSMQPPPVPPLVPPPVVLEPPQSVIISEKELLSPMEPPTLTYTSAPPSQVIITVI